MKAQMIIVSGLSGAGKTTLIREFTARHPKYEQVLTFTTRARRDENDPCYSISREAYAEMIRNHELIEYTQQNDGSFYGTAKAELRRIYRAGRIPVLNIDTDGFRQILADPKTDFSAVTSLFIVPPSALETVNRLKKRATEDVNGMILRLEDAIADLDHIRMYDAVIVNESAEGSLKKMETVILEGGPGDTCSPAVLQREIRNLIEVMKKTGENGHV